MTEANTIGNFNFGFSTHKSDILIHLSQWQYWWWFWFSVFWCMYFFIVVRVTHKRIIQLNPIINTSIRGHGKWGDFLVALIPLSWCGNILINSNFILRMIEWQNESSLFTVRIQGKQWYWVYKFDATAAYNILTAPKNIGHNRWFVVVPGESYCVDNYYQAIQLGAQLEYKKLYFKLLQDDGSTKLQLENFSHSKNMLNFVPSNTVLSKQITRESGINDSYFIFDKNFSNTSISYSDYKPLLTWNTFYYNNDNINNFFKISPSFYELSFLDDTSNFAANLLDSTKIKPFRVINGVINKHNQEVLKKNLTSDKNLLYVGKFENNSGFLEEKVDDSELVWGFKQKKYKRLQKFKFLQTVEYNPVTFLPVTNKTTNPFMLKSNVISKVSINNSTDVSFNYHKAIKFNKHRQELVPVNLARRLLRTKRTLVLPAHINLTLITNSYDVVHSWFIPGLGIKIDCVPGRSTHHTFYIDNIGFYYGQCAEICGRYHHHMPIRLCALSFDQFLVWWQKKGLKKIYKTKYVSNATNLELTKLKYNW